MQSISDVVWTGTRKIVVGCFKPHPELVNLRHHLLILLRFSIATQIGPIADELAINRLRSQIAGRAST